MPRSQQRSLFDERTVDPAFPGTIREELLCSLVLRLIRANPGLSRTEYLEATIVACRPDLGSQLLTGNDRKDLLELAREAPSELMAGRQGDLHWRLITSLLLQNGAVREDAGQALVCGGEFDVTLALYPVLDDSFIRLVDKAATRLREYQTGTTRRGEDYKSVAAELEFQRRNMVDA